MHLNLDIVNKGRSQVCWLGYDVVKIKFWKRDAKVGV